MTIRVAVVAPTYTLRAGLVALLARDDHIQVSGEAAGPAGYAGLDLQEVDVLVWVGAGSDSAISEGSPPVLVLAEDSSALSAAPLPGQVWGLLPLDVASDELCAAVRALHLGLVVAAPHLLAGRMSAGKTVNGDSENPGEELSAREMDVLQAMAQGLANKQIAVQLGISEHTVKFHVSSIFTKLDAANRTEAVRIGARKGWITL